MSSFQARELWTEISEVEERAWGKKVLSVWCFWNFHSTLVEHAVLLSSGRACVKREREFRNQFYKTRIEIDSSSSQDGPENREDFRWKARTFFWDV